MLVVSGYNEVSSYDYRNEVSQNFKVAYTKAIWNNVVKNFYRARVKHCDNRVEKVVFCNIFLSTT